MSNYAFKKRILAFTLVVLLVINTFLLYPFSTMRTVLEPLFIYGMLFGTVFFLVVFSGVKTTIAKRNSLRLSLVFTTCLLFGSVVRRTIEFLNDYVYWQLYLNSILYLAVLISTLVIAKEVFDNRKKGWRKDDPNRS